MLCYCYQWETCDFSFCLPLGWNVVVRFHLVFLQFVARDPSISTAYFFILLLASSTGKDIAVMSFGIRGDYPCWYSIVIKPHALMMSIAWRNLLSSITRFRLTHLCGRYLEGHLRQLIRIGSCFLSNSQRSQWHTSVDIITSASGLAKGCNGWLLAVMRAQTD